MSILIIMLSGTLHSATPTDNCDRDIRIMSEAMPDADLYCVAPSYALRPRARPNQEIQGNP